MQENDYLSYSVRDFVMDDSFKAWVKQPTPALQSFWISWLSEHPDKKTIVEEARQLILHLEFEKATLPEESFSGIWAKLERVFDEQENRKKIIPVSSIRIHKRAGNFYQWKSWHKIAAAILVLLLSSFVLYFVIIAPDLTTQYTTRYGETKTITLPDNSVVTLNANSSLRYAPSWTSGAPREVWLNGEAFFNVVKKNTPAGHVKFIVHTNHLKVEVLGTAFNVNNRHGNTRVVLNSGKIQLESDEALQEKPLVMQPGEYIEFKEESKKYIKKKVNPEIYSSWTQNKLIFDNTPLSEIASLLEDNYGLEIILADQELAQKRFTATIPMNDVNTLLVALAESFDISVARRNDQVIIKQ